MATIEKFEDLLTWQRARKFADEIFLLTTKEKFSKNFSLVDQIQRASGSVMDNIAEGFERGGNKEFFQFLFISKSSLGETRSQLYRAYDRDFISKTELDNNLKEAIEIGKMIGGFINYLKNSDIKGSKYKFNSNSTKL